MKKLTGSLFVLCLWAQIAHATTNCAPLDPKSSVNLSLELRERLDEEVDGLFAKLSLLGISGARSYEEVTADKLSNYPLAGEIYAKERMIYLKCVAYHEGGQITDSEHLLLASFAHEIMRSKPRNNRKKLIDSIISINDIDPDASFSHYIDALRKEQDSQMEGARILLRGIDKLEQRTHDASIQEQATIAARTSEMVETVGDMIEQLFVRQAKIEAMHESIPK